MKWDSFEIVEVKYIKSKVSFPYVPGFLSFREVPLILKCFFKLNLKPDLIFVDGQGIAHPRKMGLATHLGILLNLPTIGCAKKPLLKNFRQPQNFRGAFSPIFLGEEVVGWVLRTREGVKPVFVSPGNFITLKETLDYTLKVTRGYRLPEPVRLAHQLSVKVRSDLKRKFLIN